MKRDQAILEEIQHKYEDKYFLAETLTNTALAAQVNVLEMFGINPKTLKQLKEWSEDRSVTLRLKAEEKCAFDREEKREEEAPTKHVREYAGGFAGKITDKVVTTITEYFWNFEFFYELTAFYGNEPDDNITLQSRKGKYEIKTTSKGAPYPDVVIKDPIDANITYLLQKINAGDHTLRFSIDRSVDTCRTPRRNVDIEKALTHFHNFSKFANSLHSYFSKLFTVQTGHGLALNSINDNTIFNPVVPLFVPSKKEEEEGGSSGGLVKLQMGANDVALSLSDLNKFLEEQKRSMSEKLQDLAKVFPDNVKIITVAEANLMVIAMHGNKLTEYYYDGMNYIEDMLRKTTSSSNWKRSNSHRFFQLYVVS